jgi:hypothetical protein
MRELTSGNRARLVLHAGDNDIRLLAIAHFVESLAICDAEQVNELLGLNAHDSGDRRTLVKRDCAVLELLGP